MWRLTRNLREPWSWICKLGIVQLLSNSFVSTHFQVMNNLMNTLVSISILGISSQSTSIGLRKWRERNSLFGSRTLLRFWFITSVGQSSLTTTRFCTWENQSVSFPLCRLPSFLCHLFASENESAWSASNFNEARWQFDGNSSAAWM